MKEIFKAGIYRLLFLGLNFLVGLFIAVLSGTELFGTISLMIVNAALLHLLTALGADQAIVWHGASKKFDTNKLFTFTFFTAFLQLVLFFLVAFLFFQYSGRTLLSKNYTTPYFYLELLYFSGLIFLDKYVSLLYAQHKARVCNFILTAITLMAFIILVLFRYQVIKKEIDPFDFFCLLTFIQAVTVISFFHIITEKVRFSSFKKEDIVSFYRFSGIVFITNLIQFLAYRADFWFIDYFKDTGQVGIYAQANRFAGLLWILPNIIAALLIPVMSLPGTNLKEKELAGITRIFSFLNIVIIVVLVFISFLIYSFFLQPAYASGFKPMLLMLPGYYFFSITIILAAYFSAKNLLLVNLAGSIICFTSIAVADFLFIPLMGITGAAWANTIAYSLASLFTIVMFLKYSGFKPGELFILQKSDWNLIAKLQR
ncbi:MAG TPA: oligosaccharide flippase family protein [Chitinophagaceae bacterium]|nr:oligosaccharide flippase family protein [Chitinophagaceae bacterium]